MADVLKKIKQTEREAARQLSEAKEEASKIVSDARKKSTELVSKASDDSVANTQTILDAARDEASKSAEKCTKKVRNQLNQLPEQLRRIRLKLSTTF